MFLGRIDLLQMNALFTKDEIKKFSAFVLLFTLGQIAVSGLFSLNTFVISRSDSFFYLTASARVPDLTSFEQLYMGYIYLLHVSQFFSDSGTFMVLIQSLFVILASYALFSITEQIGSPKAAWISVSFYLLLPMLTQWTRYILTESIFYALIIIGMRLATLRKSNWTRFLLFPVIVLMIFMRPNGIISACAVLTILIILKLKRNLVSTLLGVLIWCLGIVFSSTLLSSNSTGQETVQSSIFDKTLEGTVVFGVEELKRKMPPPLTSDRSTGAFIQYISDHPADNLRLGAHRLFWEFKQVRPWYSTSLNLFISFTMFSFYFFSLIGLIRVKNKMIVRAAVVLTLPSALLIAGTWAIWEGRFAWWVLICWIPFFAVGINDAFEFFLHQIRQLFFYRLNKSMYESNLNRKQI
jgi:4-amino-4-deoxy-L-arabinose transferase-like glycosyltransferase